MRDNTGLQIILLTMTLFTMTSPYSVTH